ncbi:MULTISPECIES: hypothetical protein [Kordiimonas]|jgi:hypothetical protein|uniref:Uncharacterized protein n=1 Tax=Kordiimonas lacus TaxID=637679 RepID=A0A1G6WUB5_9PROT|nr:MULTISPECIES: hypothetical protein [Kordiimonas]SDD69404.1 hypothetical protein SAMN04488071_1224 [Kordiimonas lacus]
MYEHEWHWKRALVAVLVGPLGASAVTGILYWSISNLIVLLLGEGLVFAEVSFAAGFFIEGETVVYMSLGAGITGMALMLIPGFPLSYGLSRLSRHSKPAYIAASFMAFPAMVGLIMFQSRSSGLVTPRDIYFLSYFALITLLNGWIAHWVIHGKRKRPPERVEAVFE